MGAIDKSPYPFDLPDNSKAARAERFQAASEDKRAEKVVKGTVKVKKNEMRKLTDVFISEDIANVKSYIIFDVLVPSIKNAVYDIVVNSLNMSLFGGRGGKRSTVDRVSYDKCSSSGRDSGRYDRSDRDRRDSRDDHPHSYEDVTLESRVDAEAVLSSMDDMMEVYGIVRVGDLHDMLGITGEYTDNHYGWKNIRNAEVVHTRGGYKIKMPRPIPLHKN